MQNLNYNTSKHVQNRKRLTDIENRLGVAKGEERWGKVGLEVLD